ncbi:hypothetical protein [Candidatus Enterococcus huntleyi]|uniref:hypothetical protein n=1 Tax=Candidatus Enterococcus huntleyi TaxID=1857217 RepID=UPI00137A9FF4|nr:hypothetical protein [Enterococcus sp. JM4C]
MKNKINLIIVAFLLGELTIMLPKVIMSSLFVGASLLLFMNFDEWEHNRFVGGTKE